MESTAQGKGNSRGGPVIGVRSGKSPAGPASFSSAPSFSFFKVPPLPSPQQSQIPQNRAGKFTTNAPASSFPAIGMPPAEAPLAHCPSNASYASANSNDAQEELNLHPSLNNLKKHAPFEA